MMKRFWQACLMVICAVGGVVGDDGHRWSYGPILGATFSQMLGSELKEVQAGFAGGGFVCHSLTSTVAVRPEIMYVMRGGRRSSEFRPVPGSMLTEWTESLRTYCVDVSLLTEIALPEAGGSRPRLLIGPVLTRVMKSSYSVESIHRETFGSTSQSGVTEIGLTIGMSFHSDMPTGVLVDLRLSWMFEELAGDEGFQDRTILALVGYRF